VKQADVDDGVRDGLTTAEQAEVVRLRRENRRLETEDESRTFPRFFASAR
jgi:transposase